MLKFTQINDSEKIQKILTSIQSFHEISLEGSAVKRLGFKTPSAEGYMTAADYGSSIKVYMIEKPKFWMLALSSMCPEDLKPMGEYVTQQMKTFSTKLEALSHIEKLSVREFMEPYEVDPNSDRDQDVISDLKNCEIPF